MTDVLSVYLSDDDESLSARIEGRLTYGESKSGWAATAIRDRLTIETVAQSAGVELPDDRRERDAVLHDAIAQLDDSEHGERERDDARV